MLSDGDHGCPPILNALLNLGGVCVCVCGGGGGGGGGSGDGEGV